MSKYVKGLVKEQLEQTFDGVSEFLVINLMGVNGVDNNVFRGALLEKNIRVHMVKNTLARNAYKDMGLNVGESLFNGPCAIAYGGDGIVEVAKEMVTWSKKLKALSIKGAFLDGEVLDAKGAADVSKMPTRVEMQGIIVRQAMAPGANVAGAIMGPAGAIAGCIKSLVEKLEKEAA